MAEDREHAIEEILEAGRRVRPRTPRWLWILAGVLGAGCALAFAVVMLGDASAPSGSPAAPAATTGGRGFGTGLALGVGIGIAVGYAIARQLVRDHSSRSKP